MQPFKVMLARCLHIELFTEKNFVEFFIKFVILKIVTKIDLFSTDADSDF